MIDQYALWIGRVVMIGAGGIVAVIFLLAAWWLAGYIGADVFKRLRRIDPKADDTTEDEPEALPAPLQVVERETEIDYG